MNGAVWNIHVGYFLLLCFKFYGDKYANNLHFFQHFFTIMINFFLLKKPK